MMPMHFLTTHNDEVLSKKSPQALSADSSAGPTEALKIYGAKRYEKKMLIKKLEIEKTKPTFIISVLKVV